ncbi:transport protein SEC24 [Culex quinquefasciatus]|uniref:Transport protein SEC24 n=1 Tax=Culex quinquefasciatus TaxID=7176 RepID=B0W5K0_CULQU|nr:transport protein SEC24 [Culex quinquefasciatus]|eukprot:XP_001843984.1 transport protein SEC24 [Culex quinquefasciatus]
MANGYPPVANGPAMHQPQQFPPPQQQQQHQQQYPVKTALMNGPSSQQQYGAPPVAAVAPLQNGPPPQMMMGQKVSPPFNNTQQQNNRVANLVSNGNSATSSRTSSPALVNNNIPASQLPPRSVPPGVTYQPPSSQSQTTPVVSSNYQLSPNNNWASGINTSNQVNTPPRNASGLSTPLNASTPTVNGPSAVNNLTASMQNLAVNRPHSAQQVNHLNGSGTPQPPPTVPTSSYQNQLPPSQPTSMKPNVQQYNVVKSGFNRLWGNNTMDLLQNRHVLPPGKVRPPVIHLNHPFQEAVNCNPDIFRCTLTKIPETNQLLQKSRLPLGVLIHPFRDLNNLPVISCNTIVRCRTCRTYINPFVFFVDSKKWKCNLCYRVNELPEEFQYDPVTKTYGDPTRRPEVKSSTIEFIAPSEYMLRPPQPAIYLFLLDVSSLAQQTGYLHTVCRTLIEHLDSLPGDARTQVGFIAYNSAIHFYNIAEGYNQPHEVTVLDVDDVFLPYPDNLLINLKECKELVKDLLTQLPKRFEHAHDTHSALGAALQVAYKMMCHTGGRVTVFQTCLPNHGPGALQSREDPNNRSSKDVAHLGPATDFYKRLALDCSAQQIAVDLFLLNTGISKFSGGCMHHIPLYCESKPQLVKTLQKCFERYLTRKVGFEAVMRVRCTRGLAIHTFHGNFFVRSTDLLSLPNVNPDAGFGMQITYEESLAECKTVCFQAALLYTSSKAERRIRVHTLCIPVTASLSEVMYSADSQCIVGLLSKMAVDRSLTSSLSDARDAFINATVDIFSAFKIAQNLPQNSGSIVAPENLSLLPLYILALLKHTAFRVGTSTRLDDRVFAMSEMKTMPLDQLIRYIYPDFYVLDSLFHSATQEHSGNGEAHLVEPPRLQLSAEK